LKTVQKPPAILLWLGSGHTRSNIQIIYHM
jgi:hypothetical protein